MKIDYSSGLVLSNGDLLEASYDLKWVEHKPFEQFTQEMIYTGCFITKPNGDKIWRSNSWNDLIEPELFPTSDIIIDDYDYDQSASWQVFANLSVSVSDLSKAIERSIRLVSKFKAAL